MKLEAEDPSLTLDFMIKVFDLLQTKFAHEYDVFHLETLAVYFVFPLVCTNLPKLKSNS